MNDLTPAERLLLELCRNDGPRLERVPDLRTVDAATLFRGVAAASARHAIEGLVLSTLQRSPPGMDLFADYREPVRRSLSLIARQAAFWDLEQDRVLRAMRTSGFQPLVLKGGALRRWVYRSPVERSMGDLDILVPRRDVPPLLAILRGLGYESTYSETARQGFRTHLYHDRVTHPNGFHVEVHWDLTRPAGPVHLDPELFLQRSHLLEPPGELELRVPSAEDMVLHTVAQSHHEGVRKLRRLVDLDRVIGSGPPRPLDWDYVMTRAGEAGLHAALCLTHRLAWLLLGTPAPEELLEGRRLSRTSRTAIACMRPVPRLIRDPGSGRLANDERLLHLWCLPGWRERGRWIREWASGTRDPLAWVWLEADPTEPEPPRLGGARATLKILAQQAVVMLSCAGRLLVPGGRTGLRFWKGRGTILDFAREPAARPPGTRAPTPGDRSTAAQGRPDPPARVQLPPRSH